MCTLGLRVRARVTFTGSMHICKTEGRGLGSVSSEYPSDIPVINVFVRVLHAAFFFFWISKYLENLTNNSKLKWM